MLHVSSPDLLIRFVALLLPVIHKDASQSGEQGQKDAKRRENKGHPHNDELFFDGSQLGRASEQVFVTVPCESWVFSIKVRCTEQKCGVSDFQHIGLVESEKRGVSCNSNHLTYGMGVPHPSQQECDDLLLPESTSAKKPPSTKHDKICRTLPVLQGSCRAQPPNAYQ